MKKRIYLMMTLLAAVMTVSYAQTRITVAQGDNLITKVAEASSGDTIAIEPGFHVAQYANILVDKSLAFISTDKSVKPQVFIKQFDIQGTDLELLFDGLTISSATVDSIAQTEDQSTLFSADSYFLNLTSTHVSINNLTMKNCVIRNFGRAMLRADRAANTANTITVDNCIFYDQRGAGDYGPFRTKSNITVGTFLIQNSTFYAITNRFIDMESAPGTPAVTVKNCTFDRWGGGKTGQYLFDMKNNTTGVLKIQSSILGRTNANELVAVNGWRVPLESILEMTNSSMSPEFIITDSAYSVVTWDKTEYNLEDFDPNWADPDNGDFSLPEGSDLLQWSPDGTVIGDPRWAPQPVIGTPSFKANRIEVYPNPASEFFMVNLEGMNIVSIYNTSGMLVKEFTHVTGEAMLDASSLRSGVYIIRISGPTPMTGKILIQ